MAATVDIDPLLAMQLEELERFLSKVSGESDPAQRAKLADHICEWTRTILSRSFARVGKCEAEKLRESFLSTSQVISGFLEPPGLSEEQSKAIAVFAAHVKNRVNFLPQPQ